MKITGKTRITGIIGYPVGHTLSPPMHNAAFESLGLDYCYVPFLVRPECLEDAVKSVKALDLRGVNVTVPHKEKVMPLLDEIDEEASFIGAVNTVVNDGGRLTGHNTDGRGFMKSLSERGVDLRDGEVLIVGAGGAARAVGYYLSQEAGKVSVHGRTPEKAEQLVADLNKLRHNVFFLPEIAGTDRFRMIVNATPLGLSEGDPLPFDTSLLRKGQIVSDLIYRETPLLRGAIKRGCTAIDGLGMLLWQGVLSFELWTGRTPGVEVMREALLNLVR